MVYGWSDGPDAQENERGPGAGGGLGGIVRAGSVAAVDGCERLRRRGRPGGECRLVDMATHPLRRLEVRRFGPLSEADLNFSSGINVVVGDNDAGKSQLLRLLYACTAVVSSKSARSRDVSTKASQRTAIASKLVGVFKPDFLGRLVTRARRRSRAEVLLAFEGIDEPVAFDFASNARSEVQVKAFPRVGLDETPVFLPSHELLAIVPGLAALYDGYDVSFDETWRDTAELLARPAIKEAPRAEAENIVAPIRKLLGGSIEDGGTDISCSNGTMA